MVVNSAVSEWANGVRRSEADEEACTDIVGMNEAPSRKLLTNDGDSVGGLFWRLIRGIEGFG